MWSIRAKYIILFSFVYLTQISVRGNYLQDNYPKSVLEDASLDTAQLIKKYDYPAETHYVTTKDDYILRMHRIAKPGAPPVFLMHGLVDSSATWIIMGPDKALGYYLYDNGYDVWMGNARGNRYSRNHTTFNPSKDGSYWSFSWHEIGIYDLPAMIDYVLQQTGFKKTGYFGHSQGTTTFWVMCSMHPEYNDKITMMHALAPVAFMKHINGPLILYAKNFVAVSKNQIGEVVPHTDILWRTCSTSKITEQTCVGVYYKILGKDEKQTNATMFPTIFGHVPAGCNLKQLTHYLQLMDNDRFCQFDYGALENYKRYSKTSPPDYPLENVKVPVGLYYAQNDYLSNVEDVKRLAKTLTNVVEDFLYPFTEWNHMTMSWGIDARQLAHKRMLELMKKYSYD